MLSSLNFLLKRSFSMSVRALQEQVVRPPVQVSGIEGKYASALYSSGIKEKSLDKIEKDLTQLKMLYATNNDFKVRFAFIIESVLNAMIVFRGPRKLNYYETLKSYIYTILVACRKPNFEQTKEN
jgi:hypothetical protein